MSKWSSPRPWGCFFTQVCNWCATGVFPTPVGVFPALAALGALAGSLPHARGGVSMYS